MFLRRYSRTKDGKQHVYYALVESVRTDAGPRQHVVADATRGLAQRSRIVEVRERLDPPAREPCHGLADRGAQAQVGGGVARALAQRGAFEQVMGGHKPARSTVGVELAGDLLVEIEGIAAL